MDESKEHLLEQVSSSVHEANFEYKIPRIPWLKQKYSGALLASLILSLLANTLLVLQLFRVTYLGLGSSISSDGKERTKYAGLARNLSVEFLYHSPYESENKTLADELWNAISIDPGVVALSDGYVEEMRLPRAQRFPWDDSKGIYLLNAYHNMHCLKVVRLSVVEFQRGNVQSWPSEHVNHCLDGLREEIVCNADDTPRWTSHTRAPDTGQGQRRLCRDWTALELWAREHTACWRFVNETSGAVKNIERYRFCPEGSEYQEEVQKYWKEQTEEAAKAE